MFDPSNPTPYVIGLLVVVVGYFVKDAYMHLKMGLKEKATQKQLEDAETAWRTDLREMREHHQLETTRLEAQYEQKFQGVVTQFQNQMMSVERNLTDRMDMILRIIERRNT